MVFTGMPCVVVGFAIWIMLTDHPEDAQWLSNDERRLLQDSLGNPERPIPSLRDGFMNWDRHATPAPSSRAA